MGAFNDIFCSITTFMTATNENIRRLVVWRKNHEERIKILESKILNLESELEYLRNNVQYADDEY